MPPKLLFWGRKNEFFSGEGAQPPPRPLPRTPPPRRLAPPSEILNTPLIGQSDVRRPQRPSQLVRPRPVSYPVSYDDRRERKLVTSEYNSLLINVHQVA